MKKTVNKVLACMGQRIGSVVFMLLGGLPFTSKAQINYSQNFDISTWSSNMAPTNIACQSARSISGFTTGSIADTLVANSPNMGGAANNSGAVTVSFQYKILKYISPAVGATNDLAILRLQYRASPSDPWTTVQTFETDYRPSLTCATKTVTFVPVMNAGSDFYIRFQFAPRTGGSLISAYLDEINVTQAASAPLACSGSPAAGAALAANDTICNLDGKVALNLSTVPDNVTGVTYQWESSADNVTYTPVAGATDNTYQGTGVVSDTWFHCIVSCSGQSTTSGPAFVKVLTCQPSYTVSKTNNTFNSIVNTGSYGSFNATIPLGFTFSYMGKTFTEVQASANGWMSFAPGNGNPSNNIDSMASPVYPDPLIAPLWESHVSAINLRYQTLGTAPNRIFVTEWIGAKLSFVASPNYTLNYQVRLYESSGKVEFCYGTMDGHPRAQTGITIFTYINYSYTCGLRKSPSDFVVMKSPNSDNFVTSGRFDQFTLPECNTMITFTPSAAFSAGPLPVPVIPVNDNSSNAIQLPVNDGPCTSFCGSYYSSANATASAETSTCSPAPDDDVWFKFTLSSASPLRIRIVGSDGYTPAFSLTDASFNAVGSYSCVNARLNEITDITALAAGTYYVRVWHLAAGSGTDGRFAICISQPPVNDACNGAIPLTVTPGFPAAPLYANMDGATASASEPIGVACSFSGKDLWYSAVVPATGNLVVQLDGADAAMSNDYKLQALSGSCSSSVSIACSGNSSTQKVSLTAQAPGSTLLFRVRNSGSAPDNFWISAYDTTSIVCPAITGGGACLPVQQYVFTASNHNLYKWTPIFDASGNIAGEINPNGNVLATLTEKVNVNTGAVRQSATGYYMDRNLTITPEVQPSIDVSVRLYYKQSELSALMTASGIAGGAANVRVYKNNDACGNSMTATPNLLTTTSGTYPGGNYAQVSVPSFSSFFMVPIAPLPVELVGFTGKNTGAVNNLEWKTATEKNFSHFELQRSADGMVFSKLAVVNAKGGTAGNSYGYTDAQPFQGKNFYRLNMVDIDGKAVVSDVVALSVASGEGFAVNVYPNPVKQQLTIDLLGKIAGQGQVQVLDVLGKVLQTIPASGARVTVDMSRMPAGTYLVRYIDNSHNTVTKVTKN